MDHADELETMMKKVQQLEADLSEARIRVRCMESSLGGSGIGGPAERIKAQGFLKKKTPSIVVGREYDRRWFVMTQTHLRYFEEKGAIALDNSVSIGFVDKDPSAFSLNHPKMHRKFELRCDTVAERDHWMGLLSGNPVVSQADMQFDMEDLISQETSDRGLIAAQAESRHKFFASMMESEKALVEKRIDDLRKARDFAMQLLATDEKMEGYRQEAAGVEEGLHAQVADLQGQLQKETNRKTKVRKEAAARLASRCGASLLAVYKLRWLAFVLGRRKSGFEDRTSSMVDDNFKMSGKLAEAQHNGERYMVAHSTAKRVILDLTAEVRRLEEQQTYLDYSNAYLVAELRERLEITTRDLKEKIAELTAVRDDLSHKLHVTTEDLHDTREGLRNKTFECEQMELACEEAAARLAVASDFHWEAFRLQAESVLSATCQTFGGRVLASLSGWDNNGGRVWRDVYLWPDAKQGRLNYSHRDKRWGEVESIALSEVTSVEVEAFWEYPPPDNVRGFEHLGFYIEMRSGAKHRFCARDAVERSEWLDGLRGLLLAVCYDGEPARAYTNVVGQGGTQLPPRPAQQGASSWAAVDGGGSPRAAAAPMIKPDSPRRVRSTVVQPDLASPGTFGPRTPSYGGLGVDGMDAKVTLLPSQFSSPSMDRS